MKGILIIIAIVVCYYIIKTHKSDLAFKEAQKEEEQIKTKFEAIKAKYPHGFQKYIEAESYIHSLPARRSPLTQNSGKYINPFSWTKESVVRNEDLIKKYEDDYAYNVFYNKYIEIGDKELNGWGRYRYRIEGTDDFVWQHFFASFCLDDNLDYMSWTKPKDNRKYVREFEHMAAHINSTACNRALNFISSLGPDVFVIFADSGQLDNWEDFNSYHFSSFKSALVKNRIGYAELRVLVSKGFVVLPPKVVIVELITANDNLLRNCKTVLRYCKNSHPCIAYLTLMKEYSSEEMSEILKKRQQDEERRAERQTHIKQQLVSAVTSSQNKSFPEIVEYVRNTPNSLKYSCIVKKVVSKKFDTYTLYTFIVDKDIRAYNTSGEEISKRTVFTSNFAISRLVKQEEGLSWLCYYIAEDEVPINMLFNGASIEIIQEYVPAGIPYANPFGHGKPEIEEFDRAINHIVSVKLSEAGHLFAVEYAKKLLGYDESKSIAEFVSACEGANIDLMQSLYESCPSDASQNAYLTDCTRLFQETIIRQVDKLESFIDESDIAKIQQIKENFFDKASEATRRRFIPEFQMAEELLSDFKKEYESGIPVLDISFSVNYSLKSTLDHEYPYRKVPVRGTKIFPFRRQRVLRKGVSEKKFYELLRKYTGVFGFDVLDDVSLHINEGSAVEPDIAIVINHNKNIRIDVEIDEPYSGYDHKPIHYIGCGDEIRDENLARLGWITLRFAEEQIVWSPLCVIKEILRLVKMLDGNGYVTSKLDADIANRGEKLIKISRWTKDETIEMAERNYREEYLHRSSFGEVLNQLPEE